MFLAILKTIGALMLIGVGIGLIVGGIVWWITKHVGESVPPRLKEEDVRDDAAGICHVLGQRGEES